MNGKNCIRAFLMIMVFLVVPRCVDGRSNVERADSLKFFEWAFVNENIIEMKRESRLFPWNSSETEDAGQGRLEGSLKLVPVKQSELFLKGGIRYDEEYEEGRRSRLMLKQGHASFDRGFMDMRLKLSARERIFRTGNRLLQLVSNDSELLGEGGESLSMKFSPVDNLDIAYTESILRSRESVEEDGGLPLFRKGGDRFRSLEIRTSFRHAHAGLILSETRSLQSGDHSLIGTDLGFYAGGKMLLLEFAGSNPGRFDELKDQKLFGIELSRTRPGRLSEAFSDDLALSAEILGIEYNLKGIGKMGFIPSYTYRGGNLIDPEGELAAGFVQSMMTGWWKHPSLAMMVAFDAGERFCNNLEKKMAFFAGRVGTRFRMGFESRGSVILKEGEDPSLALSFLDENEKTRMTVTARIDGAGSDNVFSFLAEGGLRLNRKWTVRTDLLFQDSKYSVYDIELEFHPDRRFLFSASFGSFRPFDENVRLLHDFYPEVVSEERRITFFTRIWLGDY